MSIPGLFGTVIQATILGSVVGIIIFILKSTVLKKLSAKWQYRLWSVMIIKLIFPKGPESNISIFNRIRVSEFIGENELLKLAKRAVPLKEPAESSFDILAYVWLGGFILAVAWTVVSFIIMNFKVRRSYSEASDKTMEILQKCKNITGVKRNIKAIVQDHIPTASLCGIFKPAILITNSFEHSDLHHMEYTFIHELSHHKRRDIAMNYLLLFLQCVHWFNPLTWFLFGKVRTDTELATDEKAMLYIEPEKYKPYGMALINTMSAQSGKSPAILGMASSKYNIRKRIKAISKFKSPGIIQHLSGILTIVLIASVCLTSAVIAKPISDMIYQSIPNIRETGVLNAHQLIIPEEETIPSEVDDSGEKTPTLSESSESEEKTPSQAEADKVTETEKISEQDSISKTDSYDEYMNFPSRNIDSLISSTGQVIASGNEGIDMKKYAKLISFNSDNKELHSFTAKPNSQGHIQIFIEENGYDYEIMVNISSTETPNRGWGYRIPTGSGCPFFMDGLDPDKEYIITIDTYCPGFYSIQGRALIY